MASTATVIERRQHKRYALDSRGFALIQANDTEVLGTIKNISAGGLSLSYIDNCEEIIELTSLHINLSSENIYAEKIQSRSIWTSKEEGGFTTSRVHMRCCGIAFEQLNNEMRAQLNEFITSLSGK